MQMYGLWIILGGAVVLGFFIMAVVRRRRLYSSSSSSSVGRSLSKLWRAPPRLVSALTLVTNKRRDKQQAAEGRGAGASDGAGPSSLSEKDSGGSPGGDLESQPSMAATAAADPEPAQAPAAVQQPAGPAGAAAAAAAGAAPAGDPPGAAERPSALQVVDSIYSAYRWRSQALGGR